MARTNAATRSQAGGQAMGVLGLTYTRTASTNRTSAGTRTAA